jgi:hypothetical protein
MGLFKKRSLFIFKRTILKYLFKFKVAASGLTWFDFSARYRGVIQRIQEIRESEYRQFIFNLNQARDFLMMEKSLFSI